MYPLKFKNLYYKKIWGGRKLISYRENLPEGNIGESWEVACHKNGMSIIVNGKYEGENLLEVIKKEGKRLVGNKISKDEFEETDFPLLVKIINSNENLSVQVHPDDEYAHRMEDDNGKIEAWYIVDCEEGSEIIAGTKRCTKENFKASCEEDKIEDYMNKIKVKSGDLFLIEPGLVHSIGSGILLAEIQQNSDITYRLYDYHRGRKLHMDKAFEVINFELQPKAITLDKSKRVQKCINLDGFNVEIYNVEGSHYEKSDYDKFYIFTCVEGEGKIRYMDAGIRRETKISVLDSIMIPAYLGEYILSGNMKLLKSYI